MFNTIRGPLLALLVVALLAACTATAAGSGVATLESQAPGAAPSASPSMSPEEAVLAYARCMREHGVEMPDPQFEQTDDGEVRIGIDAGSAGGEVDKAKFMKADEACHSLMAAVMPAGKGQMSPEDEEKMLEFARCMREHGIDMPDPDVNGGFRFEAGPGSGGDGTTSKGIDPNDPDFQAAQEACGDLLPGKIGGGGPSTQVGPGGGGSKPGSGTTVAP
jgi:hypothetical protein